MKKLTAAVALCAALTLTGCTVVVPQQQHGRELYLSDLHKRADDLGVAQSRHTDDLAVQIADTICDLHAKGYSADKIIAIEEEQGAFADGNTGELEKYMAVIAIRDYC